jgi:hypothetical protein
MPLPFSKITMKIAGAIRCIRSAYAIPLSFFIVAAVNKTTTELNECLSMKLTLLKLSKPDEAQALI